MNRSCWHDVDIFDRPYGFGTNETLYIHEQGTNDDTAGLKATLLTSFFDIDDGGEMMYLDRLIPDSTIEKEMNYFFRVKKYPQQADYTEKGPFLVTPTTQKIHPRLRGRQMQVRYSCSVQGSDFRIGSDRASIKPDGLR
jgi:hypothetical protein